MNYYSKVDLEVDEDGVLSFYITFNDNNTFNDLLEYILYNFKDNHICSCYKFQYSENENKADKSKYNIIDDNEKLINYFSNKNNYSLRISNAQPDKKCRCDPSYKIYYVQPKGYLIKLLKENADNYKQNQLTLETKITNLEQKIIENNQLNQENEILKKENINKDTIIKEKEKLINDLNKKIGLLEAAINGDTEKINFLKNYGIANESLKQNKNEVKIDSKTNEIIGNAQLNSQTIFINFYDVIVNIKSIKDITKGWEVKMSKRAEDNYKNFKNEKIIKIGVIGNSNKGKSFILSKLSKIALPSGTSIRTEGLSIKYPDLELFKDRRIALLDSAGFETPVLKDDNLENNGENNDKEIFKEKSREKMITELFLQNYIIVNSDILIVVIGILTYSEQKLLNRIKTEIQRRKIKKPLYIIHNLITYTSIDQIKEYINTSLLKSATFNLEEGHNISTKLDSKAGVYYYEKNYDPKIYHLIFANEGSEAGNHYNKYTLDFLENTYQSVTDLQPFDVIKTVKKRFIDISKEFIEKIEKPLNMSDFDDDNKNQLIKLNNINDIVLKKCLIDELGFSNLKVDGFEPTYNYYKKDDKLIIRVESPGNSTINSKIIPEGEYTFIRLTGNKKRDKEPTNLEDNLFNSREMGHFMLDIPLKTEDFIIKKDSIKIIEKKGVLMIEYQLEEKKEDKGYVVDEDNEI